jgi:hypothetical protein
VLPSVANMIISSPDTTHIVYDYEITTPNGISIPFTLNPKAGDTIEIGDDVMVVKMAAKPSQTDERVMIPAETITIQKAHIFAIHYREREVTDLTPEQKDAWKKAIQEASKTKH